MGHTTVGARNTGVTLNNEDNDEKHSSWNGSLSERAKADRTPKKNQGGGNNKVYTKKHILEGSPSPVCSFYGTTGHTEPKYQKKRRAAQKVKAAVKYHKGKTWSPNRSSNDGHSNNHESSDFLSI
jgi:hypothetical protein